MAKEPPIPTVSAPSSGADSTAAPERAQRLDGKTTVDDKVFLECEFLCHLALSKVAEKIALEVCEATNGRSLDKAPIRIVLLDQSLVLSLQMLAALELQLALFEKAFRAIAPGTSSREKRGMRLAGVVPSLKDFTGGVEGVLDLLGLFRQDTQFSGRPVAIKENALFLEIAHFLLRHEFEVMYPKLLSFQAKEPMQLSQARLGDLFDAVFRERQGAVERLRPLLQSSAQIEREILIREREFVTAIPTRQAELTLEIQDLKNQLIGVRRNLDPDLVLFESTDVQLTDLQKSLVAVDPKSGMVALHQLNQAAAAVEQFRAAPKEAYFLFAEGIAAGGTIRIRRNLWRTLFLGDGVEFSGGAIVAYGLFDHTALIRSARTHRYMTGFRKVPSSTLRESEFNSF
jgi:hypothetical protein